MNALEARANALERQKALWLKLSAEVKNMLYEAACQRGDLRCTVSNLSELDIQILRTLGYTVRDIIEDTFEISW